MKSLGTRLLAGSVLAILSVLIVAGAMASRGPLLEPDKLIILSTTDDLVNLTTYWHQSPATLVKEIVWYFSPSYRPLGGLLFYRPLLALAGLQPLPYRILCFVLLAGNLGLMYLAIRSIVVSSEIAAISTLIGAFHPRLVDLYWNNGTIYDILCFTFYYGALSYYVRARRAGP